MATLAALDIDAAINPLPSEVPNPISCDINEVHASYDPVYVNSLLAHPGSDPARCCDRFRKRVLRQEQPGPLLLGLVRSQPCPLLRSPGRSAGRRAPLPANRAKIRRTSPAASGPAMSDIRGSPTASRPFTPTTIPSPAGLSEATIRPEPPASTPTMGEFILRYEDARRATSPADAVLEFFQSIYEAGADRANWDRALLERNDRRGSTPMSQSCSHLDQIQDVEPRTPEGCEECLQMGDTWVHLRDMPDLRPYRLLRQLEEQARHQALSRHRPPDHPVIRAGRRLALVLHRPDLHVMRPAFRPLNPPPSTQWTRAGC